MTFNLTVWDLVIAGDLTAAQVIFGLAVVLIVYYFVKFIASIVTGG